jgi:predicted DNA-binding transcriptional regulator AlpA
MFISPKRVEQKTSLSVREQKRREKENRFPKSVKLGVGPNGRIAYVEEEIDDWCAAQIAERDRKLAEQERVRAESVPAVETEPVKRKRGRPRKHPLPEMASAAD